MWKLFGAMGAAQAWRERRRGALTASALPHCLPPSGASLHLQGGAGAREEGCEGWMACCFSYYELIFSLLELKLSYK